MISGTAFHLAVGERLKRLRLAYGKSQQAFGESLDVGASAISNYEAGIRAVDPYHAFKLKMIYSAPMEWLYGGDESTLPPHVVEKLRQPTKLRGSSDVMPTTAITKRVKS
jgi:transcriptional regulator with XRE-family HTH domain